MQDTINLIVRGYLSGDREKKAQAVNLYRNAFDLDRIQAEAVSCGMFVPSSLLEFDRDNLELLDEFLPPKRMQELASGAEPTLGERKRYRALLLSQVRNGDSDADLVPAFWIHRIRDVSGNALFALVTATGYSFSLIGMQFHGLFLQKSDCMSYLKLRGEVTK
jgi:hypothetical protein